MAFTGSDIIKIIFAIFIPPVGVFLERGCNADFFINILLTILGYGFAISRMSPTKKPQLRDAFSYIPGIIHALYIILKY
jgi:uncharacterized membrane protein YqaE (UPF0057 family)